MRIGVVGEAACSRTMRRLAEQDPRLDSGQLGNLTERAAPALSLLSVVSLLGLHAMLVIMTRRHRLVSQLIELGPSALAQSSLRLLSLVGWLSCRRRGLRVLSGTVAVRPPPASVCWFAERRSYRVACRHSSLLARN